MKRHIKQGLLLLTLFTLMLTAAACGRGNDRDTTDDTGTNNGMVAGVSGQVVYAYIQEINGQARTVTLDQVELVDQADAARVTRLGLGDRDRMYKDFYIYNSRVQQRMYPLADNLVFDLADSDSTGTTGTTGTSQSNTGSSSMTQNNTNSNQVDGQTVGTETGTGTSLGLSNDLTEQTNRMDGQTQAWGNGSNPATGLENGNGMTGTSNNGMTESTEQSNSDEKNVLREDERNDNAGVLGQSWSWLDSSYDNAITSITKGIQEETPPLFAVTISGGEVIRISRMR